MARFFIVIFSHFHRAYRLAGMIVLNIAGMVYCRHLRCQWLRRDLISIIIYRRACPLRTGNCVMQPYTANKENINKIGKTNYKKEHT